MINLVFQMADENKIISELEKKLREAEDFIKRCSENDYYLAKAAEIQQSILPESAPYMPGYDIAAMMQPARGVGGDFFDYIPVFSGPGTIGIMAGDVSDKGVPAALYMGVIHGMVHAGLSLSKKFTAEKLLQWLNLELKMVSKDNMFATMLYGVLDSNTHQFSFARAGHTQPLMFNSEGRITYCGDAKNGQALGILNRPEIAGDTIDIPAGSFITIYSDGLTDETNPDKVDFGIYRLIQLVSENRGLPAEGICRSVMDGLDVYRGGSPPDDDCTIMVIKREM